MKATVKTELLIYRNKYVPLSHKVASVMLFLDTSTTTQSSTIRKTKIDEIHRYLQIFSHHCLFFINLLVILIQQFIIKKKARVRHPSSNVYRKILATSIANAQCIKITVKIKDHVNEQLIVDLLNCIRPSNMKISIFFSVNVYK